MISSVVQLYPTNTVKQFVLKLQITKNSLQIPIQTMFAHVKTMIPNL